MDEDPLAVAVVGLGAAGTTILQALRQSKLVNVVGVADRHPAAAKQAGQAFNVPDYTDNRSLLAEARPRAAYLCVPPAACTDLVAACAERGIHVWREPPLARDLAEGVATVRAMEKAGLKLAVGTQRRFAKSYRHAWELRHELGELFLGRAHYLFNWGPQLGWRGDKASSGGGALLELGYHPIDLLIWLLGLPEDVYGLTALGNRPDETTPRGEALPPYDTDDTAAAILHFAGGCMATVVTTRASGPVSEELCLHGRGGSLTVSSESCVWRDADGTVLDRVDDASPPRDVFGREVEAFARAVRTGTDYYESSGRENLLALAVIEAIYLSSQTCQPESPKRLLETHGLTAETCLANRPERAPSGQEPTGEES